MLPADGSPFRAALEASFRAKGYAIGAGGEGRAVPLAFVVDRADGEVMARLSTETLDIQPMLEIRPGSRFDVLVDRDLVPPGAYRE